MLILSLVSLLALGCKRDNNVPQLDLAAQNKMAATKQDAVSLLAGGSFKVFDEILFYDGYAATVTTPVPAGITRVNNSKYVRKLSATELSNIGGNLQVKVSIKAQCDNYDRIGFVALAFMPKNTAFSETAGKHIEIGRIITPFMDKNKTPNTVPYLFNTNNLTQLLRDPNVQSTYDIYVEFSLFGVPYDAQVKIAGCSGRNDTFFGTVEFSSGASVPTTSPVFFESLSFQKSLDNYTAGNTDQIGQTKRTITVSVPQAITDARLFVITSNHGANSGGEEYNRRNHFIYFDNVQKLMYKPGGKSCEPYRMYNTQSNGIYGFSRSDASWIATNNWCPGDIIPIREISLGNLSSGNHTFRIEVPDAVFTGKQGYIPLSVYLQGNK